ncbi:MAG: hypothetical protein PVI21_01930 [Candidatus Woesebacteria bacterium]
MKLLQRYLDKTILTVVCALLLSAIATTFNSAKIMAADATGGSSLDSAMQLSPGQYYGPALPVKQSAFYKISLNAGQELVFEGTFTPQTTEYGGTANTIKIFNQDRTELVSVFGSSGTSENIVTATTLASAEKSTQIYYIQVIDEAWGTASSVLDVTVNDRFDAGSGTDAGQEIGSALNIQAGSFDGYVSKADTDDFYVLPVTAGKLSVRVAPNGAMTPYVELYDNNKILVGTTMAQNAGETIILTGDVDGGVAYVHIKCDSDTGCGDAAVDYKFDVAKGATLTADTSSYSQTGAGSDADISWGLYVAAVVASVVVVCVITLLVVKHNKKKKLAEFMSEGESDNQSKK